MALVICASFSSPFGGERAVGVAQDARCARVHCDAVAQEIEVHGIQVAGFREVNGEGASLTFG